VVHGPAVQARDIHGGVHVTVETAPDAVPVPAQLPPCPALFTGRQSELAALDLVTVDSDPVRRLAVAVLNGVGGVGKTSLAAYWLHTHSDQYLGGVLYADLMGHDPAAAASPGDVLAGFLQALGATPENIPLILDEQAKLFRSLTSRRRMLMLLDNAASAAQVRALLPGAGSSVVVVTTRWRLAGLAMDGARFIELGPLDEASGAGIITEMAGTARADAEPDAVRDIVRLCGRLPLAICVAGALLAMHPQRPVSRLAKELASERNRLAALSIVGDASVGSAFHHSYGALPPQAARAYRLLSLLFTPAFGIGLAAAHIGVIQAEAAGILDVLTEASLLEETSDGRFRFHDLVKLYARERAEAEPAGERAAAVARAIDWYLREAVSADRVIAPGRWHLNPMYASCEPPRHASPAEALAWMESEKTGLVAAVHAAHDDGLYEQAWQLCEALWGLFSRKRYFRQWIDTHQAGLAAAVACADRPAEARMRVRLGLAYLSLGRREAAETEFQTSLTVARHASHRIGEATALEHVGLVQLAAGRPEAAIGFFTEAQAIFHETGLPRGALIMTRRVGEAYRDAGRYDEAINCLIRARELSVALGDRFHEGRSLASLGRAYLKASQPRSAIAALEEALDIVTRAGGTYEQARIRASLADAALALGRPAEAREHLTACLAIYSDLGAPEAEAAGRLLTELQ
jgi:tetratricopeptide (TPR) repeat protein